MSAITSLPVLTPAATDSMDAADQAFNAFSTDDRSIIKREAGFAKRFGVIDELGLYKAIQGLEKEEVRNHLRNGMVAVSGHLLGAYASAFVGVQSCLGIDAESVIVGADPSDTLTVFPECIPYHGEKRRITGLFYQFLMCFQESPLTLDYLYEVHGWVFEEYLELQDWLPYPFNTQMTSAEQLARVIAATQAVKPLPQFEYFDTEEEGGVERLCEGFLGWLENHEWARFMNHYIPRLTDDLAQVIAANFTLFKEAVLTTQDDEIANFWGPVCEAHSRVVDRIVALDQFELIDKYQNDANEEDINRLGTSCFVIPGTQSAEDVLNEHWQYAQETGAEEALILPLDASDDLLECVTLNLGLQYSGWTILSDWLQLPSATD